MPMCTPPDALINYPVSRAKDGKALYNRGLGCVKPATAASRHFTGDCKGWFEDTVERSRQAVRIAGLPFS
jgi:hypothetical protein